MIIKNFFSTIPQIQGQRKEDKKDLFIELLYRIGFHSGITLTVFIFLLFLLLNIKEYSTIILIGPTVFFLSFLLQGLLALKEKRLIIFTPWPSFDRGKWAQLTGTTQALLCTVLLLIIYYSFQEIPFGNLPTISLIIAILYLATSILTIFSTNR